MNQSLKQSLSWFCFALLLCFGTLPTSAQSTWTTVVNNGDYMPGTLQLFNSYNQPSVNDQGLVVFRARSKGGNGEPVHGIYSRNMLLNRSGVERIFDKSSTVPQPNNNDVTFIEFPAFPRIDLLTKDIVTRGSSQPVWTYTLEDGSDTKVGTSGLFSFNGREAATAVNQMGAVPGYEYFQVPGAIPGTKFDQFPGSPTVTLNKVVFKGNYTEDGIGKTGIFFRDLGGNDSTAAVQLIANTSTRIPNQPVGGTVTFGSTAPPSAARNMVVFAGFDNEDSPTLGGIYLASVQANIALHTLVGIGTQVPGEATGTGFTKFGEGLAFDGRDVAFWGAWGTETRSITLLCPTDGNKDLLDYCNELYPNGYVTSVPVHQGIFMFDTISGSLISLAKSPADFDDFLFWTFSGKAPGSAGSFDGEPARWRSSAFAAVSGLLRPFQVVFKARKGSIDGIYAADTASAAITTLVDTSMTGRSLDPEAPAGSTITSVGIERESLRGRWLTLTASMLDPATSESWAGIYLRRVQ